MCHKFSRGIVLVTYIFLSVCFMVSFTGTARVTPSFSFNVDKALLMSFGCTKGCAPSWIMTMPSLAACTPVYEDF